MLKVTNRNKFDLVDMFDGVSYHFMPNESVIIEDAAAHHIFGYGADDEFRTNRMIRHGWLKNSAEIQKAREKLNNFIFSELETKYVEHEAKRAA